MRFLFFSYHLLVEKHGYKVEASLLNLKLLVTTFTDRVRLWTEQHGELNSPEEVMDVLRDSYRSISLYRVDELDQLNFKDDDTLKLHIHSTIELMRERKIRFDDDI